MPRSQQRSQPSSPPPSEPDSPSAGEPNEEFLRITADIPDAVQDNPNDGSAVAGAARPEAAEAIAPEIIASALGPSFQALFHFVATKRGQHWELVEFEKNALVKGWTPILQHILAKLGNQEQVLLTLAVMSTTAIVAGKAAQDIKQASSMGSTRTPVSAASSASSASATVERQPVPAGSFEEQSD